MDSELYLGEPAGQLWSEATGLPLHERPLCICSQVPTLGPTPSLEVSSFSFLNMGFFICNREKMVPSYGVVERTDVSQMPQEERIYGPSVLLLLLLF